jgi:hypothetical protein
MTNKHLFLLLLAVAALSCGKSASNLPADAMFTELPASATGIDFENKLEFRQDFNIYTYRNFYNGGGVAIGDVNNDGLPDIFFTANMQPNRLYLNKGNFRFEDVTEKAGVGGTKSWSTGVAMADVNGDGWLDIYVCNSGDMEGDNKENELFINQGLPKKDEKAGSTELQIPIFTEKAREYGLADPGLSTHAAFFDYDKDGDLDMYLLNNSFRAIGSFDLRKNEREKRDSIGGDKLFRNEAISNGNIQSRTDAAAIPFTDVSEEAGIYGSVIGFGLGVTIGDVNKDGWQDIYVSNDFFERDYLYLNRQNGTFSEVLTSQMGSISAASMGADVADVNNDAWPDFFVTEMLPEPEARIKTKTTFDSWNRLQEGARNDYHYQFTRNMLQLNNGDGTFSEIGRLADVEATDWSWGALIQDFDNDGLKDIFVANGIYQDLTDQDFLQFVADEETKRSVISREGVDFKKLVDFIPSEAVPNYLFQGEGNLHFKNVAPDWGLAKPSFSNGSAYGDLDGDGDLDLAVNNLNMPAFLYRNNAETLAPQNHWLNLVLQGEGLNPFAVGARVTARAGGETIYLEHNPIRGFESSMEYKVHIGLGKADKVDSLIVEWYYGKVTVLTDVPANQTLQLKESEAALPDNPAAASGPSTNLLFEKIASPPPFRHRENLFVDFDRDRLLYHMISTEGPKMSVADVNGDGQEDFFIGNAKDAAGAILLQRGGAFTPSNQPAIRRDSLSEDLGSAFFDADGDGDMDLYVASGGNEFSAGAPALRDRLYLNDGRGNFSFVDKVLPAGRFESTSCVKAADYDGDGDQDLFVGMRVQPFYYGVPVNGYLLQNDGKGNFTNVTSRVAPELLKIGMITDAVWFDADGDSDQDLAVAGEWMAVRFFENKGGRLSPSNSELQAATTGWWNCLEAADLDGDGDLDLVAGNHGLNSRFRASTEKPLSCYIGDFDQNSSVEQIICQYNGAESYPLVLRHDLILQMPFLKKKYLKYESYKGQTIRDIFTPEQLQSAMVHEVARLESSVFINDGKGRFKVATLPVAAQLSPVYAILPYDFDGDGKLDLLLGGNLTNVKPEMGRYDASYGCLLLGNGDGSFRAVPARESGLRLEGEVRDLALLRVAGQRLLMVGRNGAEMQVFRVREGEVQ